MNSTQQLAGSSKGILFVFVAIWCFLALSGCQDSGIVGGGVTDSDVSIQVDTMAIQNVAKEPFDSTFSGDLDYFSVGQFNDPVFGDLKATGLIKPALPDTSLNPIVASDAAMSLRLIVRPQFEYGDTLQPETFDIVELNQRWRGKAWRLDDQVQLSSDGPIASFSVDWSDTLRDIPLPKSWSDNYLQYYRSKDAGRDSLYRINFPGLAIVPRNTDKMIIGIDAGSSKFLIRNNPSSDSLNADTVYIYPGDWAYSLGRSNVNDAPSGTFKMHSTLEQALSFDMDLSKKALGTASISQVDLVFYEDTDKLRSSLDQVSPSARRPNIYSAWLYLTQSQNLPTVLNTSLAIRAGTYNSEDGSYRFNITNFTKSFLTTGIDPELKFYITLESNDGIIHSSLFYNNQAPEAKRPKLIVTSVQNQSNSN